ncbi:hypothetical protein DFR29_1034 [Tahibacter aquaticus]|uniref:Uncharacterized protein n=1 Tax=Tahibacter aquaticus TaxID=520092 RepID=A0A4R6Z496_9GAMM|nr:hypothetical protein [Tahibacter aquaticus]TDR46473.1 hypothetical protein DFR29_1034 [Tahibacter aquaticus]
MIRRFLRLSVSIGLLGILAACGKAPEPAQPAAAAPPSAAKIITPPVAAESVAATPEEAPPAPASIEPRGPDCEAILAAKPAAIDIAGLYLGMTLNEALTHVRCRLPKSTIELHEDFLSGVSVNGEALGPQAFMAREGVSSPCHYNFYLGGGDKDCEPNGRQWFLDERVKVATPGLHGKETVTAIWRSQYYDDGERPSVNTVRAALREKYGAPQFESGSKNSDRLVMAWAMDTSGTALSKANPLLEACVQSGLNADAMRSQGWRAGCGLTIQARIDREPFNHDLVGVLHVAMIDQDKLFSLGRTMQERAETLAREQREAKLRKADASKVDL